MASYIFSDCVMFRRKGNVLKCFANCFSKIAAETNLDAGGVFVGYGEAAGARSTALS